MYVCLNAGTPTSFPPSSFRWWPNLFPPDRLKADIWTFLFHAQPDRALCSDPYPAQQAALEGLARELDQAKYAFIDTLDKVNPVELKPPGPEEEPPPPPPPLPPRRHGGRPRQPGAPGTPR